MIGLNYEKRNINGIRDCVSGNHLKLNSNDYHNEYQSLQHDHYLG